MPSPHYTIGFSNIFDTNPFTKRVRECVEATAATRDNITLISRDNNGDTPTAIENSQEFADANVDVAIVFHIDQRNNESVAKPLRDKGIPIICVDIPISRTIYYGLDNKRVGEEAGKVLADWINDHWNGQIEKTLVVAEYRVLEFFQQRFMCALDILEQDVPTYSREHTLFIDNGGSPKVTQERVGAVLNRWGKHHHIAVVCMNDDVAIGTLEAVYKHNRVDDVALMSHDGTEVAMQEFVKDNSPMKVSTKLYAEVYGEELINLAVQVASGEHVPSWNYTRTIPMTPHNYQEISNAPV